MTEVGIIDFLSERCLHEAERAGRFKYTKSEHHFIECLEASSTRHDVLTSESWTQQPPDEPIFQKDMRTRLGCLRCVFQRSRHQHVSGRPDILPFKDASSARHIFQTLAMPSVYFQIADGVPALVHANITSTDNHQPAGFQLVAHCVTKYGDWAMALSHNPTMRNTAVFWSVDKCIDSELLMADLKSLQDHAFHPMLLPCIMFAAMLRSGVERRLSIKEKLKTLEDNVRVMNRTASQLAHTELEVYPSSPLQLPGIEALFELLSTCRREQASREGRYEFWRSYHTALEDGFAYANEAMTYVPHAVFHKTHSELKQWTALSWCRFESLKARDIDHMARVDNVSDMLYNLVQQRDSYVQASIARASQRDSEDMKFIALLGSIFLPASLVASILNVQEFQFLGGAQLFGVYVAITMAFIALVVMLCIARPRWIRWWEVRRKRALSC